VEMVRVKELIIGVRVRVRKIVVVKIEDNVQVRKIMVILLVEITQIMLSIRVIRSVTIITIIIEQILSLIIAVEIVIRLINNKTLTITSLEHL
jgi:hypothetical protein